MENANARGDLVVNSVKSNVSNNFSENIYVLAGKSSSLPWGIIILIIILLILIGVIVFILLTKK